MLNKFAITSFAPILEHFDLKIRSCCTNSGYYHGLLKTLGLMGFTPKPCKMLQKTAAARQLKTVLSILTFKLFNILRRKI